MRNLAQPSAHGRGHWLCGQVPDAESIAVTATGRSELGFSHRNSGQSFVLDVVDLHRDELTIPGAFHAVKTKRTGSSLTLSASPEEPSAQRYAVKACRTSRSWLRPSPACRSHARNDAESYRNGPDYTDETRGSVGLLGRDQSRARPVKRIKHQIATPATVLDSHRRSDVASTPTTAIVDRAYEPLPRKRCSKNSLGWRSGLEGQQMWSRRGIFSENQLTFKRSASLPM
jgi:hypothetical protein